MPFPEQQATFAPTATVNSPDGGSGVSSASTLNIDCNVVAIAIADETTAWVACSKRRHRMLRIDSRDNRVVAEIPIKQGEHAIAVDEDAVWVTDGTTRPNLHRIDPKTNAVVESIRIRKRLDGAVQSLAADRDALWIATDGGSVVGINKASGKEEARVRVAGGSATLAAGPGDVWVLSAMAGTLSQIDPRANRIVKTVPIGVSCESWARPCHHGPVLAAGSVWVSSYAERTVSRIDPSSGRVAVTIPVGRRPVRIAIEGEAIWIDRMDGSRLKIDPPTNEVVAVSLPAASPGKNDRVAHILSRTTRPVTAGEFEPAEVHSQFPDPVSMAASAEPAATEYRMEGKRVDLEFLTPPVIQNLAMRDERSSHDKHMGIMRFTPGRDFFRWNEYGEGSAAVVVIQAIPKITKVSNLEGLAYGALEALFNPRDRTLHPSFRRMRLMRDGIKVAPMEPRRRCGPFKIRVLYPEGDKKWQDEVYGCYGSYTYDPKVFETGTSFTLQVFTEDRSDSESFTLDKRTVDRIRADFQRAPSEH